MPKQKDLKRVVRARMQKTGESYTTARMQVLEPKKKSEKKTTSEPVDYAALAGMSDESVKKATGCDWATWVAALDYAGAKDMSHREIARYVKEKFDTPDWWTQGVVVGYERIRGLRAMGQRRDGSYEASKSKTVGVPVEKLYKAFRDARLRARWLPGVNLTVRTATPNKSMRVTWDDDTRLEIGFTAKGDAKSQVALAHVRLASKAEAERMKAYWGERLNALAEMVKNK
jgi:hypothetical protein